MTGIDDLIICPRCLKPMGDDITVTTCQHCEYKEGDNLNNERAVEEENEQLKALLMSYGELDEDEIEEESKRDRNEYNY